MSANVDRVLAEIDRVSILAEPRSDPVIEWGEPGRIEAKLTPVPALPEKLIPGPFRKWIVDIAHRMQTPTDFAAITAMTVTASVIGAGCAIRPKRRDNWEVVPNLWGACIGRPSMVLKSPSMKEPIEMLSRLQAEAREVHMEEIKAYQFDRHVKEAQRKQLEKDIQKIATAKVKDPAKLDALKNERIGISTHKINQNHGIQKKYHPPAPWILAEVIMLISRQIPKIPKKGLVSS